MSGDEALDIREEEATETSANRRKLGEGKYGKR